MILAPEMVGQDCFEHDQFAEALLHQIEAMPAGSMIGVQGASGRGKTDVLARLWSKARGSSQIGQQARINPWRSPNDYLQPLVKVLARSFGDSQQADEALEVCQWLVGSLAGPPAYIRTELVKRLFGGESRKEGVFDSQECRARFHKLIGSTRWLVCVDDLDRLPPAQQIPVLESLFFLTEVGVGPTFVLAYDAAVLAAAARAQYLDEQAVENYLDKIFDLRISLPPIESQQSKFKELCRDTGLEARMLSAFFEDARATHNPRLLARAFSKYRFACLGFDPEADASPDHFCLLVWLILIETWPEVRRQFAALAREGGGDSPFLRLLAEAHRGEKSERNLFLGRLYAVTEDSAVNAGNIFIQLLARFNSGGKRRFLSGEPVSGLRTFVDMLSREFQICETVLQRAGV
jgi:hypothetical protein